MESLYNTIYEGLLDDFDTASKKLDSELLVDWIKKYAKVEGKIIYLKNGNLKVHGNMIIDNFDGDTLPDMNITEFKGDLIINKCKNIKSLGNWFKYVSSVDGDISVCNCDNLTSLEGLPMMCGGVFNITGNKSLKSLDGMPEFVAKNIYIMKNGRKFKEAEILKYLGSTGLLPGKKIFV